MIENEPTVISVSSSTLIHGDVLPIKYTRQHQNIHPPVSFRGLPLETASLALIMERIGTSDEVFDHWVIWNMPPTAAIAEGSARGVTGKNGHGENTYTGPHEPFGKCYRLQVFALNKMLTLDKHNGKEQLRDAMGGHILAMGSMDAYCAAHSLEQNIA